MKTPLYVQIDNKNRQIKTLKASVEKLKIQLKYMYSRGVEDATAIVGQSMLYNRAIVSKEIRSLLKGDVLKGNYD